MKKKLFGISMLIVYITGGCTQTQATNPVIETSTRQIVQTSTVIHSTPTSVEYTQDTNLIQPYQDVRNRNLALLGQKFDKSLILTLRFNTFTKWPEESSALAESILQAGMNPGLGVRALHAEGITGQGVSVAIIDQNLFLDHPEFDGKIIKYNDMVQLDTQTASMHGPAVTSLFVGENVGTAPGAKVYYVTAASWTKDAQSYADALNWIIDENETLPSDQKIRVVSVSIIATGRGNAFTENLALWQEAYQRANDAGILVVDCSTDVGIVAPCTLDVDRPDDITQCVPGWPDAVNYQPDPTLIHVPVSHRTFAAENLAGINYYQYFGVGGISWSAPYLSGVLAMGWQVNPDLTYEQMLDILFSSAYINEDGAKIINPPAFIDAVKATL